LIKQGDVLFAVQGRSVRGLSIGQLARLVLGPAGSKVEMEFTRGEHRINVFIDRQSYASYTADKYSAPGSPSLSSMQVGNPHHLNIEVCPTY
jgi:C-terminal processing protease CtpA/Prc